MTGQSRRFLQLPPPQLLASSDPLPLARDTPPTSDLNPLSPDERVLDPVTKPEMMGKDPMKSTRGPNPDRAVEVPTARMGSNPGNTPPETGTRSSGLLSPLPPTWAQLSPPLSPAPPLLLPTRLGQPEAESSLRLCWESRRAEMPSLVPTAFKDCELLQVYSFESPLKEQGHSCFHRAYGALAPVVGDSLRFCRAGNGALSSKGEDPEARKDDVKCSHSHQQAHPSDFSAYAFGLCPTISSADKSTNPENRVQEERETLITTRTTFIGGT
ncbi:hypothetical protein MJG53_007751 [Ovis ammon polii x Ovis aries]|uniref:Uncharacterized protein n=1 Tax=Ovis ammon polii x Ovis aries TaxID=2918886 RepID=A0ACB9V3Y9_9CETA|nr:hypothetical protein MJG53_007751 [Ovis ammon polii x Ovis aries]